jgi:AraC-like DNA-binding protein
MDRAARMLKQTDMNIGEVAMKCGFEDVSYFSRVFKQAFDCTPSQYRKLA